MKSYRARGGVFKTNLKGEAMKLPPEQCKRKDGVVSIETIREGSDPLFLTILTEEMTRKDHAKVEQARRLGITEMSSNRKTTRDSGMEH